MKQLILGISFSLIFFPFYSLPIDLQVLQIAGSSVL